MRLGLSNNPASIKPKAHKRKKEKLEENPFEKTGVTMAKVVNPANLLRRLAKMGYKIS